nr:immunoglobulin heavy chain junction region [Macaca mulatta]MOW22559.1 immunoglobulin heavy chain junction region [Macaca mulatta]
CALHGSSSWAFDFW